MLRRWAAPSTGSYAERYNPDVVRQASRLILTLVMLCNSGILRGQRPADPSVSTCDQESLARPGYGVAYRGTVRSDDYRFSVIIPEGLVGWGAAPAAPFHGFTIYLSHEPEAKSCIVFRIQIHVDLGEDDRASGQQRGHTERVRVGNRVGSRVSSTGRVRGTSYGNINVWLELPREDYRNDVEIVLVTPKSDEVRTKAIFARFLASFHFL